MLKKTISQALGGDIKRLRTEAGLSQTKFAALADLPQSRITSIETGEANLTISSLEKIAAALAKKLSIRLE